MYGMRKTTVYLPDDLKTRLERTSAALRRSEAAVIREAIEAYVESRGAARPVIPLFSSGDPTLAERVDEELAGFGEHD